MKQPELGHRISELRKAKGLTQEELVEKCNISVRTIQRIETGEVNPRSYTVKTILSALGSDIKEIQTESSYPQVNRTSLQLAWVAGIGYFVLGILEAAMDYTRLIKSTQILEGTVSEFLPVMDYGTTSYIIVKFLVVLTYVLFIRGFVLVGNMTGNSLLQIIAKVLIGTMVFIIGFDIVSLLYEPLDSLFVQLGIAVTLGMLGIVFGIALVTLRSVLGVVCLIAGALEIVAGCLLLFADPIGLLLQMPAVLLQIFIIYRMGAGLNMGNEGSSFG